MKARKVQIELLNQIRNSTSLETNIKIGLEMADYDNWDNGEYKGNKELINRQVDIVLSNIERWVEKNYINPIREPNE